MEQPLTLAIDIGTSSLRASVFDGLANPIRGTGVKIEREFRRTADGGSELDLRGAFEQVIDLIDTAVKRAVAQNLEVDYVVTSCFWHSLVVIDDNDQPLTPLLGWADTRSREHSRRLAADLNEIEMHNRTGARFHSSYWPAKLLWLRKGSPELFGSGAKLLSFSDFIALELFSDATTSVSMASGTGLFDIRRCEWDEELIRYLKVGRALLPKVATAATCFKLNKKYARRWPRLRNAKWFPAVADGAADHLGAGCSGYGEASLMVGTSGAMRVELSGEPPKKLPHGLWCYRIDRRRPIVGGALSDGGGLFAWLKSNLKLPRDAAAQLLSQPPDAHGLTFLPFLAGERATGYHEGASGALIGMTSSTTAVDIMQAAMESVAYRFSEIFRQLNRVTGINRIVASGGALRDSPVWASIIADVLGRDIEMNDALESSSRGAVLLALESIGKIKDIQEHKRPKRRLISANPDRFDRYRQAIDRHARAYKLLIK